MFTTSVKTSKHTKTAKSPATREAGMRAKTGAIRHVHARQAEGCAKFYQELAPKVAMDRFEIVSTTEKKKVPAGGFENVLKTKETSTLEPDSAEFKLYAPEVGLITDGGLELVKHEKAAQR